MPAPGPSHSGAQGAERGDSREPDELDDPARVFAGALDPDGPPPQVNESADYGDGSPEYQGGPAALLAVTDELEPDADSGAARPSVGHVSVTPDTSWESSDETQTSPTHPSPASCPQATPTDPD